MCSVKGFNKLITYIEIGLTPMTYPVPDFNELIIGLWGPYMVL